MRAGFTVQVGKSTDMMMSGCLMLLNMIFRSEGMIYSTGGSECTHYGDRMFDTTHYDSQELGMVTGYLILLIMIVRSEGRGYSIGG